MDSMGRLYLVATPIGNLEDLSPRALRILREVRLIAAEDTRVTRKLLTHFDIHTSITSYFEHNKLTKLETILAALSQGDVALVSDAGTPAINDPGYELVRAALAAGNSVSPIPGPSAPVAALAASGLPTEAFLYLGYLPRKAKERQEFIGQIGNLAYTIIFLEAPHRLLEALSDLEDCLGDRPIAIARELTKVHEEIWRGFLSQARVYFTEKEPRGEFTLIIGGHHAEAKTAWTEEKLITAIKDGLKSERKPVRTGFPAGGRLRLAPAGYLQNDDQFCTQKKTYTNPIHKDNDRSFLIKYIPRNRGSLMNLDENTIFSTLDRQDMLGEIDRLPDQLQSAWDMGQILPLPWESSKKPTSSIRQIVLSGLGGSAIGGDLLAGYIVSTCPVPVLVWRDYGLPAWARGPETLVIVSSHSGDTEETLSTFEAARSAECRLLAICTSGQLEQRALSMSQPLWKFDHTGQSRAAVGFSFGLLLAAFSRLGLTGSSQNEIGRSGGLSRASHENAAGDPSCGRAGG